MRNAALFSICIPTRNRAHMVSRALQSAMRQTYDNIEIVVSDNASTDNTPSVIASYQKRDPRIKYFRNETNLGILRNIFETFKKATGEYVQYLADDNVLASNYAEEKMRCFHDYPDAGLVASAFKKFKPHQEVFKLFIFSSLKEQEIDAQQALQNFYCSNGWFGLICTARRTDMLHAMSALQSIPNVYKYDYLGEEMAYDVLLFAYILSKYPSMYFTDRTTYYDFMTPSEAQNYALSNSVKWLHKYLVAVEYLYTLLGKKDYIRRARGFFGASVFFEVLKRSLLGPRTGIGLSCIPCFFKSYSFLDWRECAAQFAGLSTSRLSNLLKKKQMQEPDELIQALSRQGFA